jgi:folate-binding protein YgfZ
MPVFDLSDRVKLRLTGSDRIRFLNGQVTNDIRKTSADLSLPACVLSAKGKIEALVFVTINDEFLLLDSDPELRETLPARLERYVIADDVVIEDVTDDFVLFHTTGESAPNVPNDAQWRRAKRFGMSGWDLVLPAEDRERARRLLEAGGELFDAAEAERWRIEHGVARWGRELTPEIIPLEANLEADTIDYAKGCYIGQEVISRMKKSGQTNKRLCGLISIAGTPLSSEMRLFATNDEKEVGQTTSATRSGRLGKEIALGFVKRGANEIGTRLSARSATDAKGIEVEIVQLPFG